MTLENKFKILLFNENEPLRQMVINQWSNESKKLHIDFYLKCCFPHMISESYPINRRNLLDMLIKYNPNIIVARLWSGDNDGHTDNPNLINDLYNISKLNEVPIVAVSPLKLNKDDKKQLLNLLGVVGAYTSFSCNPRYPSIKELKKYVPENK